MAASELVSFLDIWTDVCNRGRVPTTDTTTLTRIKKFINERYQDVALQANWWWLRGSSRLAMVNEYTTGTISAVLDSTTVTGAATSWTAAMATDRVFNVIGSNHIYTMSSISAAGQTATLDVAFQETSTGAGTSYQFLKNIYQLASDCDDIINVYHFNDLPPLQRISLNDLRLIMTRETITLGDAKYYALHNYTTVDSNDTSVRKIYIWPYPDDQYVLNYDYKKMIIALDGNTDVPLIPKRFRHVLVYGALADLYDYQRNENQANKWEIKYNLLIKRMLADEEKEDNRIKLIPRDKYRKRRSQFISQVDWGSYFDKYDIDGGNY